MPVEVKQEKYDIEINKFNVPLERLKYEFDNSPENVQTIINEVLVDEISKNELFAQKYMNKEKSCKKMWSFIVECAKTHLKSANGYIAPTIIYSLALHYFEEETPKFAEEMMEGSKMMFGIKNSNEVVLKFRTKEIEKKVVKEIQNTISGPEKMTDQDLKELRKTIRAEVEKEYKNTNFKEKVITKEVIVQAFDLFGDCK